MSVKLRLTRTGAINDNCFRVVATDTRNPRDGRFIEILGWYDPKKEGDNFNLKMDRVEHWQNNGAQLSDTVRSLVRRAKRAASVAAAVSE
jgi:small subunit ribosomal protein S16